MPDLGEQLRRYLDATTVAVDIDDDELGETDGSVISLLDDPPRHWTGRVKLIVAAAAVAAAGVAGIFALRSNDGSVTVDTVDESEVVDADPAPVPRPSGVRGLDLEWMRGSVPGDQSGFVELLSDGKTLYWIGSTLSSSTDGRTWIEVEFDDGPAPTLLGMQMVDAVFAGQVVSSSAAGSSVLVEMVGIDGSIRSTVLLPELDAVSAATEIVEVQNARATIGPRGTVVTARLVVLDFGPLIEDVFGVDAELVVAVRAVAQVEDETFEVELATGTETIRLLDHGIEDSHDLAVAPSGPIGWHSSDGASWTSIPSAGPFTPSDHGEATVTATTGGFVALAEGAWFSTDGTSWDELDNATAQLCCEPGVAWNGQALMRQAGSGVEIVSDQGSATLPLSEADAPSTYSRSFGAGEAGIAYLVDVDPDVPTFEIVYSPDGISWQRQPLPESIGELYCCYLDVYGLVVGRDEVGLLADGEGGLELWLGTPTSGEEQ